MPNPFQYRPNLAAHAKGICRIVQTKRTYTRLTFKTRCLADRGQKKPHLR